MNWIERRLGGHISFDVFGLRVVLYGFNAMHVALNVWLPRRRAYLCFHPPMRCFRHWWPWYLYLSPDATPCTAFWGLGPGFREDAQGPEARRLRREERGFIKPDGAA